MPGVMKSFFSVDLLLRRSYSDDMTFALIIRNLKLYSKCLSSNAIKFISLNIVYVLILWFPMNMTKKSVIIPLNRCLDIMLQLCSKVY